MPTPSPYFESIFCKWITLTAIFLLFSVCIQSQELQQDSTLNTVNDSIPVVNTLLERTQIVKDSISKADTIVVKKHKRDWANWTPKPKTATWLAVFIPGAGQIYNRKFWKLPIVYGGFMGCAYAVRWNNMMYKDYKQAYHDIMDDDDTTNSYQDMLHLGTEVNESNLSRYQNLFKQRKDRYRRWRDLSIFATVGVYLLQIVDAYVDASLSEFDISNDLSFTVEPTVLNSPIQQNSLKSTAVGIQCAFNF